MTSTTFTIGRTMTAIGNETVKGLHHAWRERLQILIEMPLFVSYVLLIGFTIGKGETIATRGELDWSLDPRQASWLLIGMAAFIYTYLHVQKMFWRLLAEIQAGTLEQTYLSPLPSWVHVVAGRVLAAIAETIVVVGVVYTAMSVAVDLEMHWRLDALLPLVLLIAGSAGLALIHAGITLVWKRIQMLNDLVLMLIFFFSGAVLPHAEMPGWAAALGMPLFMTHSIAGLRAVLLNGQSLAWDGTGGLGWMLGTTVAWIAAGLLVFTSCERIAKRCGSLGQY